MNNAQPLTTDQAFELGYERAHLDLVALADDAIDRLYATLGHALKNYAGPDDELYELSVQWAGQAAKRWRERTSDLRHNNTGEA